MGMSLVELGKISGLHRAHIARVETGKRFPTGRTLRRLAKPLGFSELGLLIAAGFISQEGVDEILDKVKQVIKDEVVAVVDHLSRKADNL